MDEDFSSGALLDQNPIVEHFTYWKLFHNYSSDFDRLISPLAWLLSANGYISRKERYTRLRLLTIRNKGFFSIGDLIQIHIDHGQIAKNNSVGA